MQTPERPILRVEEVGGIAVITLNRPDVHNAFDATLISSLAAAFEFLGQRQDLRAIVLRGNGPSFRRGRHPLDARQSGMVPRRESGRCRRALESL